MPFSPHHHPSSYSTLPTRRVPTHSAGPTASHNASRSSSLTAMPQHQSLRSQSAAMRNSLHPYPQYASSTSHLGTSGYADSNSNNRNSGSTTQNSTGGGDYQSHSLPSHTQQALIAAVAPTTITPTNTTTTFTSSSSSSRALRRHNSSPNYHQQQRLPAAASCAAEQRGNGRSGRHADASTGSLPSRSSPWRRHSSATELGAARYGSHLLASVRNK